MSTTYGYYNDYYNDFYSLRDQYQMGPYSTHKHKHRSGRSLRKSKPTYYQGRSGHTHTLSRHTNHYPTNNKQYLNQLPPELKLTLFDTLDPATSTCLGLTCKEFYPIHRSKHRKVGLYEGTKQPLAMLLRNWAPDDLMLDYESEKLVSRERYEAKRSKRRREREREESERYGNERQYQHKLKRRRNFEVHDIWHWGRRSR